MKTGDAVSGESGLELDYEASARWKSFSLGLGLTEPSEYVFKLLESLQYGGALLDRGGHVLSLNLVALASVGDGLTRKGNNLCVADRFADCQLREMIALTLDDAPSRPQAVIVQRRGRLPLVIRALLLDDASRTSSPGKLLLLIFDPEIRRVPSRELLQEAFQLTPVEADIAVGIVSGRSLAEIAAVREVKVGTVRTHSKAVFAKTHTKGQVDLTRLLGQLAFIAPQIT